MLMPHSFMWMMKEDNRDKELIEQIYRNLLQVAAERRQHGQNDRLTRSTEICCRSLLKEDNIDKELIEQIYRNLLQVAAERRQHGQNDRLTRSTEICCRS